MKALPSEIREAAKYRWLSRKESLKDIGLNLEVKYGTLRKWVRQWKDELAKTR